MVVAAVKTFTGQHHMNSIVLYRSAAGTAEGPRQHLHKHQAQFHAMFIAVNAHCIPKHCHCNLHLCGPFRSRFNTVQPDLASSLQGKIATPRTFS